MFSLHEKDRGIEGLVYLNKVYEKYITLVEYSAILNRMNKHEQLLVIDTNLLISSGSSINSNDFNSSPIIRTDEEDLWHCNFTGRFKTNTSQNMLNVGTLQLLK